MVIDRFPPTFRIFTICILWSRLVLKGRYCNDFKIVVSVEAPNIVAHRERGEQTRLPDRERTCERRVRLKSGVPRSDEGHAGSRVCSPLSLSMYVQHTSLARESIIEGPGLFLWVGNIRRPTIIFYGRGGVMCVACVFFLIA